MEHETYMDPIKAPCGNKAYHDYENQAHICGHCGAVVGSMGMPSQCIMLYKQQQVANILAGKSRYAPTEN